MNIHVENDSNIFDFPNIREKLAPTSPDVLPSFFYHCPPRVALVGEVPLAWRPVGVGTGLTVFLNRIISSIMAMVMMMVNTTNYFVCVCNTNPKAAGKGGGVRVPTSSWRNFGPLDFFLRARMDDSSLFANDTLAQFTPEKFTCIRPQ